MLTAATIQRLIDSLTSKGILFEVGLTDAEINRVQLTFGFQFPPDLRQFLQAALPVSPRFPNWRSASEEKLWEQINFALDGLYFDIEHNNLWLDEWGTQPDTLAESLAIARRELATVPRLIPVYIHRFIPSEPPEAGNPVFSVHQSDIIIYGNDLAAYLSAEFGIPNPSTSPETPRAIRFWSEWLV